MQLYIVRHGIAEDLGAGQARTDAERGLTRKGRERTRQVAGALAALDCRPECIATSPLRRAEETAAILAEVLRPGLEPEACDLLAPGAEADDLAGWLTDRGAGPVMVVGHMPDVAELASQFIAGSAAAEIAFKKAGACRIDFDETPCVGAGELVWLMQPRQLLDLTGR
jgi:phosphohistidine phosphatase